LQFDNTRDILNEQISWRKEVYVMARICAVTGKKPMSGNSRSHSLRATRRKWNVNLQKVKIVVDGKPQTVKMSARALRSLKVQQQAN
jgi:large subunit ribosomal protein L28